MIVYDRGLEAFAIYSGRRVPKIMHITYSNWSIQLENNSNYNSFQRIIRYLVPNFIVLVEAVLCIIFQSCCKLSFLIYELIMSKALFSCRYNQHARFRSQLLATEIDANLCRSIALIV